LPIEAAIARLAIQAQRYRLALGIEVIAVAGRIISRRKALMDRPSSPSRTAAQP
jgi:hypothetical protein